MARPCSALSPERVDFALGRFVAGESLTYVADYLKVSRSTLVSALGNRYIKVLAKQGTVTVIKRAVPPPPVHQPKDSPLDNP